MKKLILLLLVITGCNSKKNPEVKYVLPFENRGEECGVTLHHPHGQIYAYPFIPPTIETEIKAFRILFIIFYLIPI